MARLETRPRLTGRSDHRQPHLANPSPRQQAKQQQRSSSSSSSSRAQPTAPGQGRAARVLAPRRWCGGSSSSPSLAAGSVAGTKRQRNDQEDDDEEEERRWTGKRLATASAPPSPPDDDDDDEGGRDGRWDPDVSSSADDCRNACRSRGHCKCKKEEEEEEEEEEMDGGTLTSSPAKQPALIAAPPPYPPRTPVNALPAMAPPPPPTMGRFADELARAMEGEDQSLPEIDPVRYGEPGWRDRYYQHKLGIGTGVGTKDDAKRRALCIEYVRGLCWVLRYYYQGVPSWTWYFPYHYAPPATDLIGLGSAWGADPAVMCRFELGEPFAPLEQLMAVLPPLSAAALPPTLAKLMCDRTRHSPTATRRGCSST